MADIDRCTSMQKQLNVLQCSFGSRLPLHLEGWQQMKHFGCARNSKMRNTPALLISALTCSTISRVVTCFAITLVVVQASQCAGADGIFCTCGKLY